MYALLNEKLTDAVWTLDNGTPGIGTPQSIIAAFSATDALLALRGAASGYSEPATKPLIIPVFIRLICRTIPASGTRLEAAISIDATNRYSSGGLLLNPKRLISSSKMPDVGLVVTDTFTGTPGNDLTTYSPTNWQAHFGQQIINSAGNAMQPNNAAGHSVYSWKGGAFSLTDQYAQVKLVSPGGTNFIGPMVRVATDGTQNGYYVHAGTGGTFVGKVVAGTYTDLSASLGAVADQDILKLTIVGTTLNTFKNGVLIDSRVVTDFASGRVGLKGFGNSSLAFGDNFEGGDLSTGNRSIVNFGALTLAAESAAVRRVERFQLRSAAPVQHEEYVINFAGAPYGYRSATGLLGGATALRSTVTVAPVVLVPPQTMMLHVWAPGNVTTPAAWEPTVMYREVSP